MTGRLLVKDVRPMGGPRVDLLVERGRIRERRPGIEADASVESVDGGGRLVLPGLVDGHMHLDKTHWGLPWRPHQAGPRIIDRIETERLRAELRLSPAVQSARLARQAIANGTTHIRTHVDVDTEVGLAGLAGLVETRKALADAVTMQIVAFPQSGVMIRPGTREPLDEAVRQGPTWWAAWTRRHRRGSQGPARRTSGTREAARRGRRRSSPRSGRAGERSRSSLAIR